jgi:hypothetical protein
MRQFATVRDKLQIAPAALFSTSQEALMKLYLSVAVASVALGTFAASPAFAVDFEYFRSQSCSELGKELEGLQKAEKAVNEGIKKKESKANTQAVVTTLLVGWPFWGNTDHGDANNQFAEIRTDIKYVTRAQKVNKCS